jgi:protein phosphatase
VPFELRKNLIGLAVVLLLALPVQLAFVGIAEQQSEEIRFEVSVAEGGNPLDVNNYVNLRIGNLSSEKIYSDKIYREHPGVYGLSLVKGKQYTIDGSSTQSNEHERWQLSPENRTTGTVNNPGTLKFVYYHQYNIIFKEPHSSCKHQPQISTVTITYKQFGKEKNAKIGESVWADRGTEYKLEANYGGERWIGRGKVDRYGNIAPSMTHQLQVKIVHSSLGSGMQTPQVDLRDAEPGGGNTWWVDCGAEPIVVLLQYPFGKYFLEKYKLNKQGEEEREIEDKRSPKIQLGKVDEPADVILVWKKGALLIINASRQIRCEMEIKGERISLTPGARAFKILPNGLYEIKVLSETLSNQSTILNPWNREYKFRKFESLNGTFQPTQIGNRANVKISDDQEGKKLYLVVKYEVETTPNLSFWLPIGGALFLTLLLAIALSTFRRPKGSKAISRFELKTLKPLPKPLSIGVATSAGPGREKNEDSGLAIDASFIGAVDFTKRRILIALSDGMGGHKKGEVASSMCIDLIAKLIAPKLSMSLDECAQYLPAAIKEINREIFSASRSSDELKGMGTTVAVAILGDGKMLFTNVGDSRIYLYRDGGLKRLTKDHTLAQERADRGEIPQSVVRSHPDRNFLTKVLGYRQEVDVEPFLIPIKNGDRVLLCSDGVWAHATDLEMADIISRFPDPQVAANALINLARGKRSNDDMTAILVLASGL